MCRAIKDGGQRCVSHARKALATAARRLRDTGDRFEKARQDGSPKKIQAAREQMQRAQHGLYQRQCDYASTEEGREVLWEQWQRARERRRAAVGDEDAHRRAFSQVMMYESALEQGDRLREIAQEQQQAAKHGTGLVPGVTIQPANRLARQGWLPSEDGAAFTPERAAPVESTGSALDAKPSGGVWTSQRRSNGVTDWQQWTRDEEFLPSTHRSVDLYANPSATVLVIDSTDAFQRVSAAFPGRPSPDAFSHAGTVNWEQLSEHVDAVHVTDKAISQARADPLGPNLDLWDVPSTVWFDPKKLSTSPAQRGWPVDHSSLNRRSA